MTIWLIEPRDPLIVRDARPFGPNPGARAKSLNFPFPSTIAGGVRTNAGKDSTGVFATGKLDEVKKIGIIGPLLFNLDAKDDKERWLLPAPTDALLLNSSSDSEKARRCWLQPLAYPTGAESDLPQDLLPVGLPQPEKSKPHKDAPQFWYWAQFAHWLLSPQDDEVSLEELGLGKLAQDRRLHVAIKPDTLTGDDGALFSTSGLEFTYVPPNKDDAGLLLSTAKRLALAVVVEQLNGLTIDAGLASLGGERRMMRWRHERDVALPAMPAKLLDTVKEKKHCRVVLLTPAYFEQGWKPTWLCEEREGVMVELKATAVDSPQVVSGWDFEKCKPKPTRRLAPAGSVYYLKLDGEPDDIEKWVNSIWFKNVSDNEEDRLAGFGLAAVGVWDGVPATLQIEKEKNDNGA
jgi:CRISPR-associated protein Cmr3